LDSGSEILLISQTTIFAPKKLWGLTRHGSEDHPPVGIHPIAPRRTICDGLRMNSSPKAFILLLVTLALALFTTTGCQTSKGFGKDVETLGEKIQDKAK